MKNGLKGENQNMSDKKGGIILLGIIAIAALGFSGYMYVKNEIFATPGTTSPETGLILVGLWDDLTKNTEFFPYSSDDSWLIEVDNNVYNDTNHIEVSNNNTSFKLLEEGFYKITLLLTLSNVDANHVYWAYLRRNGAFDHCFARVAISANPSSPFYQIESSVYVKSYGLDNFTINCYSTGSDAFEVGVTQTFNQLAIEYNQ
jgi:hypothetical protein